MQSIQKRHAGMYVAMPLGRNFSISTVIVQQALYLHNQVRYRADKG